MATLHLRGEIDLTTREDFERALEHMTDTDNDLTIDLGELRFIDGAGLRTLARTAELLDRHGRRLRLDRPSPHVRRLLTLVGLE